MQATLIDLWESLHAQLRAEVPWGYDRPDEALAEFLASVPRDALVLDVGCGNGRNAAYAAARGFRVVGVDASPTAVAIAKERLPDLRFDVAELPPFPHADREFGAAWDIGCLHAIHPERWPQYGSELARVLAPGASVYLHARLRPASTAVADPVYYVDGVPEWGLCEEDLGALFPEMSVVHVRLHEGRPPERFLRLVLERRSC